MFSDNCVLECIAGAACLCTQFDSNNNVSVHGDVKEFSVRLGRDKPLLVSWSGTFGLRPEVMPNSERCFDVAVCDCESCGGEVGAMHVTSEWCVCAVGSRDWEIVQIP